MITLFFSYSHRDEALRDELDRHLSILKRKGIISSWHDRRINAGAEIDNEISQNLKNAKMILLLVSSDFLASDYCYDREMEYAMQMHNRNEAVVIPVILRPCDWHETLFGSLMATPSDGKPVTKFASYDEAFLEITDSIKAVVKELTANINTQREPNIPIEQSFNPLIRSSNLSLPKKFSDLDRDKFLDEAYDYIANYFEASLEEMMKRNSGLQYKFKRLDSQSFSAIIYINEESKAQCMIFLGGYTGNVRSISFSNSISSTRNSLNDSLTVADDQNLLYLTPLFGTMMRKTNDKLTFEGAAEHFWIMLIAPLQKQY
jgi:hypothetical protein